MTFDAAMILLKPVVQVGAGPVADLLPSTMRITPG